MTDRFGQMDTAERDTWLRSFAPSDITFLELKTGRQLQELSLAAVRRVPDAETPKMTDCILAVGRAALSYRNEPGVAVFSPLRFGQIAEYTVAQHMFRLFYKQLRPGLRLWKPVMYIHEQEYTTEVEEIALQDAGLQIGARRVVLYRDSLPAMLDRARTDPSLQNGYILHIETRENKETL